MLRIKLGRHLIEFLCNLFWPLQKKRIVYGNWKDLFKYFKKDSRAFLDFNLLYLCYLYQYIRTLSTEILNTHVSKLVSIIENENQ
jgi:hypothetical protein